MDANQLRFYLLSENAHWRAAQGEDPSAFQYDSERRALRLASTRSEPTEATLTAKALDTRLDYVPGSVDSFGTWAYWRPSKTKNASVVMAAGAGPKPRAIFSPHTSGFAGKAATDVAIGFDEILYIAIDGFVVLVDLRNRWSPTSVPNAGCAAWRIAPIADVGAFVLAGPPDLTHWQGSTAVRIARISGRPLPRNIVGESDSAVFRPHEENPAPPKMDIVVDGVTFAGEIPVAIAASPAGKLAVLSWIMDAASAGVSDASKAWARIRLLGPNGLGEPISLEGARRPYSFAWLSTDRIATLLCVDDPVRVEVVAYRIEAGKASSRPLGDHYPLVNHDGGAFFHSSSLPPRYGGNGQVVVPLQSISLPSYETRAVVENDAGNGIPWIDTEQADAAWHRLYVEAVFPPRCGLRVFLAATNTPERPSWNNRDAWHEHVFGAAIPEEDAGAVPRGVWVPLPSEIPFQKSFLKGQIEPGRRGLFTVLIQRPDQRVRTLRGRYLWVRLELVGDGRSTPEVAAVRTYASRFSYAENYLPELYRESVFGEEADEKGNGATAADFLERFLSIAEGILTPIEDRIANAFMLTDPRTVPEESLEWLANWTGVAFDPIIPLERRRSMLLAAPEIRKWHGTLRGLQLAIDAVTDGGVTRGTVVIVEDFRLRRTFATILGADLGNEEDPLLPGLFASGNSFVGDTLFLGDERKKEFLALFGEGIETTKFEEAVVDRFFDRLAHRVTILLHGDVQREELAVVRRIAELEAPAHVRVAVAMASRPFMVGIASLIGADSYLGPPEKRPAVRVGQSILGVRDVLERLPSLDPRLQGGG